jgi:magnesium transporter
MEDPKRQTTDIVVRYLRSDDNEALRDFLAPLHAADVADVLGGLENPDKVRLLKCLGNEKAADVLSVVDERSGQALLELLTDSEVVSLLEEMPSDDAVDLITSLSPEKSKQIDALLPTPEREKLHELMEFEEDTAGGIMEVEKVAVRKHATIKDAIALVRKLADDIENVQSVYVVDQDGILIGSIPILDLILHESAEKVTEVMDDHVISVPVEMDQEDVAGLFGKYDQFALPVVDEVGRLVGRIMVDDIIDVLEEEATEDIARIVGTGEDEIGEKSPIKISRTRLPWLIIGMLGEILNAVIMSRFEVSIRTVVTLAFFIPLVIGTAGNTGSQAAVVVVREIALGQIQTSHIWRKVFRELQVTLLNGLVLGIILFSVVYLWQRDVYLGALLWGSLMSVTVVAAVMGASLPLILNRIKIDPAIATGPFVTVSNDIIGLSIYMAFASYYITLVTK